MIGWVPTDPIISVPGTAQDAVIRGLCLTGLALSILAVGRAPTGGDAEAAQPAGPGLPEVMWRPARAVEKQTRGPLVYLFRNDAHPDEVKIGKATRPVPDAARERFRQYRAGVSGEVTCEALVRCASAEQADLLERALHREFTRPGERLASEWRSLPVGDPDSWAPRLERVVQGFRPADRAPSALTMAAPWLTPRWALQAMAVLGGGSIFARYLAMWLVWPVAWVTLVIALLLILIPVQLAHAIVKPADKASTGQGVAVAGVASAGAKLLRRDTQLRWRWLAWAAGGYAVSCALVLAPLWWFFAVQGAAVGLLFGLVPGAALRWSHAWK